MNSHSPPRVGCCQVSCAQDLSDRPGSEAGVAAQRWQASAGALLGRDGGQPHLETASAWWSRVCSVVSDLASCKRGLLACCVSALGFRV